MSSFAIQDFPFEIILRLVDFEFPFSQQMSKLLRDQARNTDFCHLIILRSQKLLQQQNDLKSCQLKNNKALRAFESNHFDSEPVPIYIHCRKDSIQSAEGEKHKERETVYFKFSIHYQF